MIVLKLYELQGCLEYHIKFEIKTIQYMASKKQNVNKQNMYIRRASLLYL